MGDLKVERDQNYTCGRVHVHTQTKDGITKISSIYIGVDYATDSNAVKQINEIQIALSLIQSEIARFENISS
jgi:hypothetical protein